MELENGASFSLETLLEDPGFRTWVLKGDKEQEEYWKAYEKQHPERKEVIAQARLLLLDMQAQFELNDLAADEVELKLAAQLRHLGSPEKLGSTRLIHLDLTRNYRLVAAASVLLLLLVGFGWWWTQQRGVLYVTEFGEWETVELPDGSEVRLNANTSLELDDDWDNSGTRRVRLSGEAYFQVEKKPETQRRFQVITEDLTVEVLGTTFNVHSRGERTEVFLEEGSVRLDLSADMLQEMKLEPGQKLAYSKAIGQILDSGPASADLTTSWKDGLLKFDKTPMREVLQKVEEIYGITFQVEDEKLYDRPITSQGVPMKQLEVTLPILARALGLSVQLKNDIYMIK